MNKEKKTIALIHYSYPPVVGGVESILQSHARMFSDYGYRVKIITGFGEEKYKNIELIKIPEINSDGGKYNDILSKLHKFEILDNFEESVEGLISRLNDVLDNVDVCFCHNILTMHFNLVLTTALTRIIENSNDTMFVGWIHDATFCEPNYKDYQLNRYPWNILKRPVKNCYYTVISNHRQKQIRKLFKIKNKNLPVIPNGIDISSFLNLTPEIKRMYYSQHFFETDIIALTPTRIVKRKNLEFGMKVILGLKNLGKKVRWIITGIPDPHNHEIMRYYHKLLALRRKLRLQSEVIFLYEFFNERISVDDLKALYNVSDILLFPSVREGFGIPVLEGALSRLVLVLNNIKVLREIAKQNAVYINESDNPRYIAKKIIRILNKNAQFNLHKKITTNYSWEVIFNEKIKQIIENPYLLWKKLVYKNQEIDKENIDDDFEVKQA